MSATEPFTSDTAPVDFQLLFSELPTALLVMDTDLVIVEANAAYLELVGRRREELVGRPVFEAFPPAPDALDDHGRNPVEISFTRARETGRVDPMPIAKYDVMDLVTGKLDERYRSRISAPVLDADGRTVLILQLMEDVSAYVGERSSEASPAASEADLYARMQELEIAQEARDVAARRLASLAELALQLTAAETVEDLERIVVTRGLTVLGADGGGIISPDDQGGWRATLSDALGEHARLVYGNVPYDSPLPAPWVARTGREMLLPTRESGLAFDASMAGVYDNLGRYGWAFLPLTVNEVCIGSLAVAWTEEHAFGSDELELLRVFAAQCAQVLMRIRATAAQRAAADAAKRTSETLQRSLLTDPPHLPGLEVAVRYQPAAQEAQVGGDWYDVFVTEAGSTLLVVGDVSGHDRTAAAMMGQVRNVLRGIAYESDDSPAVLLSRLDRAMQGLGVDTLATAVLARVEQSARGHRLRWSNAGHLPPVLRLPDGTLRVLDHGGDLLLGLDGSAVRSERLTDLPAGSTVVLFTDGLVERRDTSIDVGVKRVVDALAVLGDADPEVMADAVVAAADGTNEDDIAVLVVRTG